MANAGEQVEICFSTDFWKIRENVVAHADAMNAPVKVVQDAPYIGYRIMMADEATDLPVVHVTPFASCVQGASL